MAGCSNIVEGSILVMMMARRVGLATVMSEFFSIRIRLVVRRLRGLYWTSIVCGTFFSYQAADISPADNPAAEIRWG